MFTRLRTFLVLTVSVSTTSLSAIVSADATDGFGGFSSSGGNGGSSGTFIGSSSTSMDTSGSSWGFFASNGETAEGIYQFGQTLSVGDTVSIQVALGFINTGGSVGFSLQNSSGTNRFETYYIGSDATDAFKINDAEGQENITGCHHELCELELA